MKKIYSFTKRPTISATSTIVGKEEKNGPLGEYFDCCRDDTKFGMQTWELAESEMVRMAFDTVLKKSKLCEDDIDIIFAGDLIMISPTSLLSVAARSSGDAFLSS